MPEQCQNRNCRKLMMVMAAAMMAPPLIELIIRLIVFVIDPNL